MATTSTPCGRTQTRAEVTNLPVYIKGIRRWGLGHIVGGGQGCHGSSDGSGGGDDNGKVMVG